VILPDVNVLVYAFRDDAIDHLRHREWLLSIINGEAAYAVSPQVLSSFARICTHQGIFARPSRLEQALQFCETLMQPEQCQLVQPGVRHWHIFADLCRKTQASGNLVQDAWFAALAIEHGCQWITADRHYARFPGLQWRPAF
jgi:uncharacterized protein